MRSPSGMRYWTPTRQILATRRARAESKHEGTASKGLTGEQANDFSESAGKRHSRLLHKNTTTPDFRHRTPIAYIPTAAEPMLWNMPQLSGDATSPPTTVTGTVTSPKHSRKAEPKRWLPTNITFPKSE